jgi:formamidopyrimidine-DNA glycosylase
MPELPEVETVRLGLIDELVNNEFIRVDVFQSSLRQVVNENINEIVKNRRILSLSRRGKYLLINLERNYTIIIHLGMSGKIIISSEDAIKKHDHVRFHLNNGKFLTFHDPRRFGLVLVTKTDELDSCLLLKHLGPEPLDTEFNSDYLFNRLSKMSKAIKLTLMDNTIVVGVGNIYACESLFLAGINPSRKSDSLTRDESKKLVASIKQILTEAIKAGGSSLKDYVKPSGDLGYFQHSFKVYGKKNERCINCSSPIATIKQGGRNTFFCPTCQL